MPHPASLCSLLLFASLAGCASLPPMADKQSETVASAGQEEAEAPQNKPTEDESAYPKQALSKELLFGFLLADIAAQRGEKQLAADTWLQLAQATRDPRAARRALEVAYAAGRLDNALAASRLWRTLEPDQLPPRQMLLSLQARSGRLAEAEAELAQWLKDRPQDAPGIFLQAHTLWPAQADKRAILALTQRLAAAFPTLPEAALAISTAANAAGDTELAIAQADVAIGARPNWETAVLYRAALTRTQSSAAALDYLREAHQRLPMARDISSALARELADAKQYAQAEQLYHKLGADFPGEAEFAVGEALAAVQSKRFAAAEAALKRALQIGVSKPDALRYYLGVVSEEQANYQQARDNYALVDTGELGVQADMRLARVEARLGNQAAALAAVQRMPDSNAAEQVIRVQLEAQVWRELKQLQQARSTLDLGLSRHPDSADLLYDRSLVLDMLGDIEATERDLRRYLVLKPDNTLGLNALGYTLANRTERFAEAEQLLRQALQQEPDNPVILDSMGWLELRRGNLAGALQWLSQAYQSLPDPEIAAHYGEALWRQGKQREARKIWDEGRKLDPQHEVLLETLQRLGAK